MMRVSGEEEEGEEKRKMGGYKIPRPRRMQMPIFLRMSISAFQMMVEGRRARQMSMMAL